jgi:transcriptional regulator with XRE-family HTH domain
MLRIKGMKRPAIYPSMTAEQFKDALARIGWSQADFAERAGLTRPTVSRWATGFAPPPPWAGAWLETLLDLAALRDKYLAPPKSNSASTE